MYTALGIVFGVLCLLGLINLLFTKSGRNELKEYFRQNRAFETKTTMKRAYGLERLIMTPFGSRYYMVTKKVPRKGWWQASDGKWYPPESHPKYRPPPPPPKPEALPAQKIPAPSHVLIDVEPLLALGRQRGYLTQGDLVLVLQSADLSPKLVEDLLNRVRAEGIEYVDEPSGAPTERRGRKTGAQSPSASPTPPSKPRQQGPLRNTKVIIRTDEVWRRIIAREGDTFRLVRGQTFTYKVDGKVLRPSTVNQNLSRATFERALERVPLLSTADVQDLRGPSYLYAILMDDRIRERDW